MGSNLAASRRDERAAVLGFVAVGTLASAFYLVIGRRLWFANDEWDFLSKRTAGDLHSLLRPHFYNWSTLPSLVYRLLWWAVGLRTYMPYQALIVALHLLAAWLVRCVMRRAGVAPWIATVTAIVLVTFGRGQQNILWAYQITQVGSLAFGLTHLLLADHDGPLDSRDWLGLAAGAAGMLCSGVAVTMVIIVGIATLIRRGWRIAAVHTVPLGLVYLIWMSTMDRVDYGTRQSSTLHRKFSFVATTLLNALRSISAFRGGAVLVVALLVVGLVVAWRGLTRAEWSTRAAAPVALLIGAGVFLAMTSLGRAGLPGAANRSRYIDLTLALMLPALAVAADAIVRSRRALTIPVLALLLIGIPGNLRSIATFTARQEASTAQYRRIVLALPRHPLSRKVPRALQPISGITMAWLLDGVDSGRIPPPGATSRAESATNRLRLSLRLSQARGAATARCRTVTEPVLVHLRASEALRIEQGTVRVTPAIGPVVRAYPAISKRVVVSPLFSQITFRVLSEGTRRPARVCGPARAFWWHDGSGR